MKTMGALTISRDRVLRIYALYAEKYEKTAKAMQADCNMLGASGYIPSNNSYWESVAYIDEQIAGEIEDLRKEGKPLVAYKVEHALPLASVSPSRLLKILEVCGVQYED
jgi:hypothetical protein